MSNHHDVRIIGAGIAGSYAARLASEAQLSVKVSEQTPFESLKGPLHGRRCGSGIWHEKLSDAGIEFPLLQAPSWVRHATTTLALGFCNGAALTDVMHFPTKPYLYIDRQKFEEENLSLAHAHGAELEYGVNISPDHIESMSHKMKDSLLLVSTGINSRVTHSLLNSEKQSTWKPTMHYWLGAQYTFDNVDLSRLGEAKGIFLSTSPEIAYFYIFPFGNESNASCNIGVWHTSYMVKHPYAALDNFIKAADEVFGNVLEKGKKVDNRTFGKLIPVGKPLDQNDFNNEGNVNLIALGDAAKNASSVSGGGIGYALRGASCAVKALKKIGQMNKDVQLEYWRQMQSTTTALKVDVAMNQLLYPKGQKEKSEIVQDIRQRLASHTFKAEHAWSLSAMLKEVYREEIAAILAR